MQIKRLLAGMLAAFSCAALGACSETPDEVLSAVFITPDAETPRYVQIAAAAQEESQLSDVANNFAWVSPEKGQTVASLVSDAVSDGAGAIMLIPDQSDELAEAIQAAMDDGIPVVCVDRIASVPATLSITADDMETGRQAGRRLVTELTDHGITSGTISVIASDGHDPQCANRLGGFRLAIAESGAYELEDSVHVADRDPAKAQQMAEACIADGCVALFSDEAYTTTGTATAVMQAQADGHPVVCVGIGNNALNRDFLRSGALNALVTDSPASLGQKGADAVLALADGKEVDRDSLVIRTTVLTAEDVQEQDAGKQNH